ncbi:hypothetical protein BG011_005602 [Mortierella polycephala]|uniref:Serine protease n=1 Tax=Mortierella polycephala TaxID=41804 RepID=A0A9P6U9B3_9FUNG|nr:hypothetical protein BG011_005602 [Mortierella polycephala]
MRFTVAVVLSTALVLLKLDSNIQFISKQHSTSNFVAAQVSVPGQFPANLAGSFLNQDHWRPLHKEWAGDHDQVNNHDQENNRARYIDFIQRPPPTLRVPDLDNGELWRDEQAAERKMAAQGGSYDGSYRFGKAIAVDTLNIESSTLSTGRWIPYKNLKQQVRQHSSLLQQQSRTEDDESEETTMVWQLEIYSPSALSLNLIFSAFRLPAGTEFYVSGRRHILGAFTAKINNKPDGIFATAPVEGDRLLLEYYTPKKIFDQGVRPQIQLSHIIHGYKPMLHAASSDSTAKGFRLQDGSIVPRATYGATKGFKDQRSFDSRGFDIEKDEAPPVQTMSGKCNVDVACHLKEYYDQTRSVGVLLTDYNQKYCTGALINNARQDGRQLFLTANHCAGYTNTSSHIVMFNHEKAQCGSNSEVVNKHDTAQGLVKLASYVLSDYTLYEIVEPIPDAYNLYLSGWSALPRAPSSRLRKSSPLRYSMSLEHEQKVTSPWRSHRSSRSHNGHKGDPAPVPAPTPDPASAPVDPSESWIPIVCIHHPSGDAKKISFFFNGSLPQACWGECHPEEYFHWKVPHWDKGTTEPGSSGSPLFDADKRIVGQLHGGSASCWNKNGYDMYGAIFASFQTPPKIADRLATYLDPEGTRTKLMDGYSLEKARRDNSMQQQQSRLWHENSKSENMKEEEEEEEDEEHADLSLGTPDLEKPLVAIKGRPARECMPMQRDKHYSSRMLERFRRCKLGMNEDDFRRLQVLENWRLRMMRKIKSVKRRTTTNQQHILHFL